MPGDENDDNEDESNDEESLLADDVFRSREPEVWTTLTQGVELPEGIDRDLIALTTPAFERAHHVKVPRGVYVISHDVYDLPTVEADLARRIGEDLSRLTPDDVRDAEKWVASDFERELAEPRASESMAQVVGALAALGQAEGADSNEELEGFRSSLREVLRRYRGEKREREEKQENALR